MGFLVAAFVKKEKPIFVWLSVLFAFITLVGMVMGREHLRMVSLQDYFTLEELTLNPSYSSLAMFLITFIIGIATLIYLIRLIYTLPKGKSPEY
jgi:hypothetical protein